MPIRYWDIERFPELETAYGMEFMEWDELFATVDVLSVQLALKPETEGSSAPAKSDHEAISLFINTARGKLVDQPALTDAGGRAYRRGGARRLCRGAAAGRRSAARSARSRGTPGSE